MAKTREIIRTAQSLWKVSGLCHRQPAFQYKAW